MSDQEILDILANIKDPEALYKTFDEKRLEVEALYEFTRRVLQKTRPETITGPQDVGKICFDMIAQEHEEVRLILLDNKNHIIKTVTICKGLSDSAVLRPREVFRIALRTKNVTRLIVVHNHPSGDPTPSQEDIIASRGIFEAGKIIGIEVLDSVIVGKYGFYSMQKENQFTKK